MDISVFQGPDYTCMFILQFSEYIHLKGSIWKKCWSKWGVVFWELVSHTETMQNPIYTAHSDYSDYNCSSNFKVSVEQMGIQVNKFSFLKQQYTDFSPRLDFWYFWNPSRTASHTKVNSNSKYHLPRILHIKYVQKTCYHFMTANYNNINNTIPSIKYYMNYT